MKALSVIASCALALLAVSSMVSARNGAETGMSTGHEAAAGNRDRGSALTASGSDVSAKRRSELRFGRGYEYRMSRQRASGSPAGQPSQNEAR